MERNVVYIPITTSGQVRPNKKMCGSGYPTYPKLFSPVWSNCSSEKKLEGKACILEDFFR